MIALVYGVGFLLSLVVVWFVTTEDYSEGSLFMTLTVSLAWPLTWLLFFCMFMFMWLPVDDPTQ